MCKAYEKTLCFIVTLFTVGIWHVLDLALTYRPKDPKGLQVLRTAAGGHSRQTPAGHPPQSLAGKVN